MTPLSKTVPRPSPLAARHHWLALLLFLPFFASILGSWAWFNTDLGRSVSQPSTLNSVARQSRLSGRSDLETDATAAQPRLWLTARTNLDGYTFIPDLVSDSVKKTLGTTNILSGTFYRASDHRRQKSEVRNQESAPKSDIQPLTSASALGTERITVFLATWTAESKKPLLMLGHTPDICWTGAGWKPIDLGQPRHVFISLPLMSRVTSDERPAPDQRSASGNLSGFRRAPSTLVPRLSSVASAATIPFSCLAFESPNSASRELAVWCVALGGNPIHLTGQSENSNNAQTVDTNAPQSRLSIIRHFFRVVDERHSGRGGSQIVRYSMPVGDRQESTCEKLRSFAPVWLRAERL